MMEEGKKFNGCQMDLGGSKLQKVYAAVAVALIQYPDRDNKAACYGQRKL